MNKILPNIPKTYIIFDLETTGFSKWDDILQFASVDCLGEEINEYFSARPTRKTWKKAEAVNGITPEMVRGKPRFYNERNRFKDMFKKYQLILGYNILKFDIGILRKVAYIDVLWFSSVVDVFNLWKDYKKRHKIYTTDNKLETVANYFGYNFEAHNAIEDVYATAFILNELLKDDIILNTILNIKKGENL